MILYNQGSAFNGTVFTGRSPGLYLFHVSVITFSDYNGIRIFKNVQQLTLRFLALAKWWVGVCSHVVRYRWWGVSTSTWFFIGCRLKLFIYWCKKIKWLIVFFIQVICLSFLMWKYSISFFSCSGFHVLVKKFNIVYCKNSRMVIISHYSKLLNFPYKKCYPLFYLM